MNLLVILKPPAKTNLDAETVAACKITHATQATYTLNKTKLTDDRPKAQHGEMKLPEQLRRYAIMLQPDVDMTGLKKIGDEVSEALDYTPGELYVKQYIRPKYVQPASEANATMLTA